MDSTIYGIDATNAGQFSQAAYDGIGSDPSALIPGWREDTDASQNFGGDQVRVFYSTNPGVDEVVMAFRGTANLGSFKDDLLTDGFASYSNFLSSIERAYGFIQTKEPEYKIYTDGHSLGGEFAQNFAVLENLDGFGQNSLPVTSGNDTDVLAYQGSGNKFIETNVVGDPATLWYSYVNGGLYLDPNPANLPSDFPALEVLGMTAAAVSSPVGVAAAGVAFYSAHSIKTLNWLSDGYTKFSVSSFT